MTYGLKTGTSNVKTDKGNRPRDGWVGAYTPGHVAMFWAGNADATPMNKNAFGGTILANPLKKFFGDLVKNNYISNQVMPEKETSTVQISKISGKLSSPATPAEFVVSTLKYSGSPSPIADDGALALSVDASCNGQLSPYTPAESTKHGYLIKPSSFMPNGMDIGEITQRRKESVQLTGNAGSGKVFYNFSNIFVEEPKAACDGGTVKEDTTISVQLTKPSDATQIGLSFPVSYTVQATKNIRKIMVLLDNQVVATFPYTQGDTKQITDTKQVTLVGSGFKNGTYTLQVVAFDFAGFSNKKQVSVTLNK